jgi:phytanoyl-CoA hydroxylase
MIDKNRTRKSMVIHYLREETLCWHELSQRPALVEKII